MNMLLVKSRPTATAGTSWPRAVVLPSGELPDIRREDLLGEFATAVASDTGASHWVVSAVASPSGGDLEWYRRPDSVAERSPVVRADVSGLAMLDSWIAEEEVAYDTEARDALIEGLNAEREGQRKFPK